MMKVPLGDHEREVAHEDRLALDLTGVVVGELGGDVERGGVGEVLLLALLDGVLRVVEDRVLERQRHGLAEVLDRGDLLEDLLQPGLRGDVVAGLPAALDLGLPGLVADQPVEAVGLEGEELRELEGLGDLREGDAVGLELPVAVRAAKRCPFQGRSGRGTRSPRIRHRAGRSAFEKGANVKSTPERGRDTTSASRRVRDVALDDERRGLPRSSLAVPGASADHGPTQRGRSTGATGLVTRSSTSHSSSTRSMVSRHLVLVDDRLAVGAVGRGPVDEEQDLDPVRRPARTTAEAITSASTTVWVEGAFSSMTSNSSS